MNMLDQNFLVLTSTNRDGHGFGLRVKHKSYNIWYIYVTFCQKENRLV